MSDRDGLCRGGLKPFQPLGRKRRYHQTKKAVTVMRIVKKRMVIWTMLGFPGFLENPL